MGKQICEEYIELLTKYILPKSMGHNDETEVFWYKALADTFRYLAEVFLAESVYKSNAERYYQTAFKLSSENLNATHPTRLGVALNFSVFYTDILNDAEKACKMAKYAFDSSIEKLDTLNDASYKDSTLIMQILRDNLTLWTAENDGINMEENDGTIGFAVGGARDINNFRECILNDIMPSNGSITFNGLLYDYYFETKKKQKNNIKENEIKIDDGSKLFYPSYCMAKVNKLDFMQNEGNDEQNEYYLTVGLNSNIKQKDLKRKRLNLVVVLDKSGSMNDCFDNERSGYYAQFNDDGNAQRKKIKTKMEIANECIVGLLKHLTPKDRFGIIVFDSKAAVYQPMNMMKDIEDLEKLKNDILRIQPGGGTNFEFGYNEAIKMYDVGKNIQNDEEYDNRIIFVTDAQPNHGRTDTKSLLGMVDKNANNKKNYIYTTFIGVGLDFNAKLIEEISATRGCNYYSVQSTQDFNKVMDDDFDFMVNPLVFNVSLRVKAEGNACCIQKVYGTTKEREEGIIQNGEITKINTLFPSKKSKEKGGGTKGGIQLIKLRKNENENEQEKEKKMNVEIQVTFEDKYGAIYNNVQYVTFEGEEKNKNDMIESNDYYDNTGIRKGILLCKYAELMMEWIQNDSNTLNVLTVSEKYKNLFAQFLMHFEREMKELKDPDLQKEVNLIRKLVN